MPLTIIIPLCCDECTQCSENRFDHAPKAKQWNKFCELKRKLLKTYAKQGTLVGTVPDWCPIRNGGLVRKG